jgi:hypothetical protein
LPTTSHRCLTADALVVAEVYPPAKDPGADGKALCRVIRCAADRAGAACRSTSCPSARGHARDGDVILTTGAGSRVPRTTRRRAAGGSARETAMIGGRRARGSACWSRRRADGWHVVRAGGLLDSGRNARGIAALGRTRRRWTASRRWCTLTDGAPATTAYSTSCTATVVAARMASAGPA